MKVAIVSSFVPFIKGGARNIVDWLALELRRAGHQAEVVYLPFSDDPARLLSQHAAMRWVEVENADVVVCLRAPAHLIRHERKVVWFIHHVRYYYDLWDTPYRVFPADRAHLALRDTLRRMDTRALEEAHQVFTNSGTVARRLSEFNGIDAEVLYPPLFEPERFTAGEYGDEILYVSRLEHHKRQHLAVQAMRHTTSGVRLRIAGTGSNPDYLAQLEELVWRYQLADRVTVEHGWLPEDRKAELIGQALAVAYLPFDEDSYGYPSLEAAHAARPIVTTTDSGGVTEFVVDEQNGLIRQPDASSLAHAFDRLHQDRDLARRLGAGARARIGELDVSWDRVLERLLA